MGAGVVGVGGRAARWLRLLLLLVMALAAVEYLCGSILDASPLRTYLYTPLYNATQPTFKSREQSSSSWPKRLPVSLAQPTINPEVSTVLSKNNTIQALEQKSGNITNITESISTTKPNIITKIMNALKTTTENEQNSSALPLCDEMPPNLGPIPVNKTEIELVDVEHKYPEVQKGGQYAPPNCTARHKVAIIVPYRDRQQHLAIFLNHMHPFLMKQQIEYGIFIVEQAGNMNFNRAKLFNVGFVESQKQRSGGWQCFIFHDVDLLPMDERNMYSCPRQPRHMSAAVDKFQFKLLYPGLFGGVSALTREQFTKVNGFSNNYWGWGAEDDDMAYRLSKNNYHIARYKMSIARYAMLHHKPQTANPKRFKLLSQGGKNFKNDGLNSLRYELMEVVKHHLYTLITVNVDERS